MSDVGKIVDVEIQKMNTVYDAVRVDKYCIMPDHIHLIIGIGVQGESERECIEEKSISIPTIIKSLKRVSNKETGRDLWQDRYHDHVIRSMEELFTKIQYVETNPLRYLLRTE